MITSYLTVEPRRGVMLRRLSRREHLMHESIIARLRLRVGSVLVVKHVLAGLTFWGFAWGTVVLVTRMLQGETPDWLWWGLLSALPVALAAGWYGWTQVPAPSVFRAIIDNEGHCGGLLMAAEELPL